MKTLTWSFGLAALTLGIACGGHTSTSDLEHQVTGLGTTDQALASPAPSADPGGGAPSGEQSDDDKAENVDKDCHGVGDHAGHEHHRHHKFKVLDGLDGKVDDAITIASLPAGLPVRLLEKLGKLDADHDGVVTKAEAKAGHHGKHGEGPKRDKRERE
jgi:hypothetical protein